MTRLEWIVLRRIAARVGITFAVFFGIAALGVSLDVGRFQDLSRIGGPLLGISGIVTSALRTAVSVLPVVVLIGTIIGVLDLQARRELTIIKSTGASIWRIVRAPLYAAIVLGLFIGLIGQTLALQADRYVAVGQSHGDGVWLEQAGKDGDFVLEASRARNFGTELEGVTIFFTGGSRDRIQAESARLTDGAWALSGVTRYRADGEPKVLATLRIATGTGAGDMRVKLTSARELTLPELVDAVGAQIADPDLRAGALTYLYGLLILPALLGASVLIGFAFTSGYRRTNKYGGAVLYGIVLGFVVYVVTELATRSGVAGVLDPAFAAAGPAFVAIVIGLTVLLYKEDGRA